MHAYTPRPQHAANDNGMKDIYTALILGEQSGGGGNMGERPGEFMSWGCELCRCHGVQTRFPSQHEPADAAYKNQIMHFQSLLLSKCRPARTIRSVHWSSRCVHSDTILERNNSAFTRKAPSELF